MLRHKEPTGRASYAADTTSNRTKTMLLQRHAKQRQKELSKRPGWRSFYVTSSREMVSGTSEEDMRKSCFYMTAAKHFHRYDVPDDSKNFSYNYNELDEEEIAIEKRKEYFIKRHEAALAKRRTAADHHRVIKKPSHAVEPQETGPSLLNRHRQELVDEVPLMTRTLKGEFYRGKPAVVQQKENFVTLNRQNVKVASQVNQTLHDGRAASASAVRRPR